MTRGSASMVRPDDDPLSSLPKRYQEMRDSRVMGITKHGPITAVCVTNQPWHEVSYRGPAEDTCAVIFEWVEGPTVFPWQQPIDVQIKALKAILSTVTEVDFYRALAVNTISLKILYAMFMALILTFDVREEPWWVVFLW